MAYSYTDLALAALDGSVDGTVILRAAEVLLRQGKLGPARELLKRRLLRTPDLVGFWHALARLQIDIGNYPRAIRHLRHATTASTDDPAPGAELIACLDGVGRLEEADRVSSQLESAALASELVLPGPVTRLLPFRLGRRGQFVRAWRLRHHAAMAIGRSIPPTRFAADPSLHIIDCGTLLGEAVECAGFLAASGRADRFVVRCADRLHDLFARSFPDWTILRELPADERAIAFEAVPWLVHEATGKKPTAMGGMPFLQTDGNLSRTLRRTLRNRFPNKIVVGIGWRSRPKEAMGDTMPVIDDAARIAEIESDRNGGHHPARSLWRKALPIGNLSPLFEAEDIAVVSLQHGLSAAERGHLVDTIGLPIHFAETDLGIDVGGDLDPLAALIAALDGVISVPGTHTHLSGALGIPTVIPLHGTPPHLSDWPMLGRLRLYPRLRVIERRATPSDNGIFPLQYMGDWRDVVSEGLAWIRASADMDRRREPR